MDISWGSGRGISISDDNLAACSAEVAEKFLLRFDDELGAAFDGVAIHSCGSWAHTMPAVARMKNIMMIDCVLPGGGDFSFNEPELVRDALRGTGVIVQVRPSGNIEEAAGVIKRLWAEDMRLVIKVPADLDDPKTQYEKFARLLQDLYS